MPKPYFTHCYLFVQVQVDNQYHWDPVQGATEGLDPTDLGSLVSQNQPFSVNHV